MNQCNDVWVAGVTSEYLLERYFNYSLYSIQEYQTCQLPPNTVFPPVTRFQWRVLEQNWNLGHGSVFLQLILGIDKSL